MGKSPRPRIVNPHRSYARIAPALFRFTLSVSAVQPRARERRDALDQRAPDARAVLLGQHIELVELGRGRIDAIPRGEADRAPRYVSEREPGAILGYEARERGTRIAAREHVIDLGRRQDARVMAMPDVVGERAHDRDVGGGGVAHSDA